MCWEDHEVVTATIQPNDRVAMVCSAGDLVLTALVQEPSEVIAIDTNPDQLALLQLKMSAYAQLSEPDLQLLLGTYLPRGSHRVERRKLMEEVLQYDQEAQLNWTQQHMNLLSQGVLHAGRFEHYLQTFTQRIFPFAVKANAIRDLLAAKDIEAQRRIYRERINSWLYRICFKYFFGKFYMRKKGRHPDLLEHVRVAPDKVFYDRMKHAFFEVNLHENPFLTWLLKGRWEKSDRVPIPYRSESIEVIPSRLDRIRVEEASIPIALQQLEPESLDMIYLSDITETMDQMEADALFDSCACAVRKGGRMVIWNNLVERRPGARWELDEERSAALWEQRKVSFYGHLGVYDRL